MMMVNTGQIAVIASAITPLTCSSRIPVGSIDVWLSLKLSKRSIREMYFVGYCKDCKICPDESKWSNSED